MDEDEDTGFGEIIANPEAVWKDEPSTDVAVIPARPADMPEFKVEDLVRLAREVAVDIQELPTILHTFNLTEAHYAYLSEHNEFFKQALKVSRLEWASALSAPERVRLQAAAILEAALPRLGARMVNQAEGLPGVVETAKLFAKVGGLGEREASDRGPSERFTISINLGGGDKIVRDVSASPAAEAGSTSTISIKPKGQGDD